MNKENNIAPVNEELNVVEYKTENIKNLIFTIRGKQVMLDSDVAKLYHYETKYINLAVRRNKERFPENFCFQLTKDEVDNLRLQFATASEEIENTWSQIATASEEVANMWSQSVTTSKVSENKFRNKKYLPYAFTEQGIAMLSGLLKNDIAIQVSINIMNAFVEMRKFILNNAQVFERLTNVEYKMLEHDKKFDEVFDELQRNKKEEFKQQVFFNGQIYDSYSLIIDIIKTAQEKILIIDNYIDDTILKMLAKKNKNVEVVILTSEKSNISKLDIQKFNKEYSSLKLAKTNKFHDRFMIIDNKELYHCRCLTKRLRQEMFCNF